MVRSPEGTLAAARGIRALRSPAIWVAALTRAAPRVAVVRKVVVLTVVLAEVVEDPEAESRRRQRGDFPQVCRTLT